VITFIDPHRDQFLVEPICGLGLWFADITFVWTWRGFCYTAFVSDVCTKNIAGWAISSTMRSADLPLQALNNAVWHTSSDFPSCCIIPIRIAGRIHPIAGYTDRLAGLGIAPSVGSRGDSYDSALAEAVDFSDGRDDYPQSIYYLSLSSFEAAQASVR
jgi:transposase InsO family protein